MAKIFDRIQITKPRSNVFDLSHEKKLSMNMGDLVPVMCQEVIPGDKFRVNMEHLIRFQPLQSPMMHRVNVYTHFFFVPNRLVWTDFEKFITGGEDGNAKPIMPHIDSAVNVAYPLYKPGSLLDYFGIPVNNLPATGLLNINFNTLPFRAYQTIYNEYYRDQNLESPILVTKSSGKNIDNLQIIGQIRKRAWEKDYFTSALPWAQRGTQLSLPITGQAPVYQTDDLELLQNTPMGSGAFNGNLQAQNSLLVDSQNQPLKIADGILNADMSNVSASTINELRSAFSIQRWLEKSARAGSRYKEQTLSFFGVDTKDSRLQRPEYLGGGKTPVVVSEVLQTSATQANSPQGTMAGHGLSVGSSNQFNKRFTEHGYVIGIMSVLPRTSYQNGTPRHFLKRDKFEYYWPEFAHIGEQPILNQELFDDFKDPSISTNKGTFGYQPRYAEYRFAPDTVHGDFATNLDFWHMGRKFTALPLLNKDFVQSNPTHRVFAVTDPNYQKLLVQTYVNFQAIRPVSKFGTPGML